MFKEFYRNHDTGTHWLIVNRKTRSLPIQNKINSVDFYPFPTLKFHYLENNIHKTSTFDIDFVWLIWGIRITRHWGEAYKEQEELLKKKP